MTADNRKPQKYLSQQPREMRSMPFADDTPPEYLPSGIEAILIGLCALVIAYLLASVL